MKSFMTEGKNLEIHSLILRALSQEPKTSSQIATCTGLNKVIVNSVLNELKKSQMVQCNDQILPFTWTSNKTTNSKPSHLEAEKEKTIVILDLRTQQETFKKLEMYARIDPSLYLIAVGEYHYSGYGIDPLFKPIDNIQLVRLKKPCTGGVESMIHFQFFKWRQICENQSVQFFIASQKDCFSYLEVLCSPDHSLSLVSNWDQIKGFIE